ncbi:MAG: hypothetical protein JWQ71_192 [Pedosphaera sp.]|nr:hypothetical protein [Pedosphaera sp.]
MKYLFLSLMAVTIIGSGCVERRVATKPAVTVAVNPPVVYTTNSPGTKFSLLPSAVQRTISSQAGSAEIKDINKVTGANREIYEIRFRDPALNPTLFVGEDGSLINTGSRGYYSGAPGEFGGTSEGNQLGVASGLPFAVQRTLQQQSPNAVVVDVQKSRHTLYEITFKDPNLNPKMLITEDGTILRPTP